MSFPWISPRFAACSFSLLVAGVCLFQLALSLGAPWGNFAMGGRYPATLPPAMRIAALAQIALLLGAAAVLLARSGQAPRRWMGAAAWAVVALCAASAVLNLITPSAGERMVWAPVAIAMLLASLRVALAR